MGRPVLSVEEIAGEIHEWADFREFFAEEDYGDWGAVFYMLDQIEAIQKGWA